MTKRLTYTLKETSEMTGLSIPQLRRLIKSKRLDKGGFIDAGVDKNHYYLITLKGVEMLTGARPDNIDLVELAKEILKQARV